MNVEELLTIYLNEKNRNDLFRYAVMLTGNYEDAGDLVADLAVMIYTNEQVQHAREPMAYFKTCMRYAYYNQLRRKKRLSELSPTLVEPPDGELEWMLDDEDQRARSMLREMLSDYPTEWINAFEAFYLDHYSQKEIARQLGVNVNTVTQHFKRMRKKLSKRKPMLYLTVLCMYFGGM